MDDINNIIDDVVGIKSAPRVQSQPSIDSIIDEIVSGKEQLPLNGVTAYSADNSLHKRIDDIVNSSQKRFETYEPTPRGTGKLDAKGPKAGGGIHNDPALIPPTFGDYAYTALANTADLVGGGVRGVIDTAKNAAKFVPTMLADYNSSALANPELATMMLMTSGNVEDYKSNMAKYAGSEKFREHMMTGAEFINKVGELTKEIAPRVGDAADPDWVARAKELPLTHPNYLRAVGSDAGDYLGNIGSKMALTLFAPEVTIPAMVADQFVSDKEYAMDVLRKRNPEMPPAMMNEKALEYSLNTTAVGVLLNKVGLDNLVKAAPLGKAGFVEYIKSVGGREGVNVGTNVAESLYDKAIERAQINPDINARDFARSALESGLTTVPGSIIAGRAGRIAGISRQTIIDKMVQNQADVDGKYKMLDHESPSEYEKRMRPYANGELLQQDKLLRLFNVQAPLHKMEREARNRGDQQNYSATADFGAYQNRGNIINPLLNDTGAKIIYDKHGNQAIQYTNDNPSLKGLYEIAGEGDGENGYPIINHILVERRLNNQKTKFDEQTKLLLDTKEKIDHLDEMKKALVDTISGRRTKPEVKALIKDANDAREGLRQAKMDEREIRTISENQFGEQDIQLIKNANRLRRKALVENSKIVDVDQNRKNTTRLAEDQLQSLRNKLEGTDSEIERNAIRKQIDSVEKGSRTAIKDVLDYDIPKPEIEDLVMHYMEEQDLLKQSKVAFRNDAGMVAEADVGIRMLQKKIEQLMPELKKQRKAKPKVAGEEPVVEYDEAGLPETFLPSKPMSAEEHVAVAQKRIADLEQERLTIDPENKEGMAAIDTRINAINATLEVPALIKSSKAGVPLEKEVLRKLKKDLSRDRDIIKIQNELFDEDSAIQQVWQTKLAESDKYRSVIEELQTRIPRSSARRYLRYGTEIDGQKQALSSQYNDLSRNFNSSNPVFDFGKEVQTDLEKSIEGKKIDPAVRLKAESALNKYLNQAVDFYVAAGEISQETGDIWKKQGTYAPLRRNLEQKIENGQGGFGGARQKKEGSDVGALKSDNQALKEIMEDAVSSFLEQKAKRSMVRRISEYQDKGLQKVYGERPKGEEWITVMENGTDAHYKIEDQSLRQLFTDLTDVEKFDDMLLKPLTGYTKMQQMFMTKHPLFMQNSAIRSQMEAFFQRPEHSNILAGMWRGYKALRDQEFMDLIKANGGSFEKLRNVGSGETGADEWFKRNVKNPEDPSALNIAKKIPSAINKGIDYVGQKLESYARAGTAKKIYDETGSIPMAVEGSQYTGPFYANKGNNKYTNAALRTVTFGPAQTQGWVAWNKNVRDNPKAYSAKVAAAAATWMAYRIWQHENKDPAIMENEGSHMTGMTIPAPFADKEKIKIPVSHIENGIRLAVDYGVDEYYRTTMANESARMAYKFIANNGLAVPALPATILQLAENKNWYTNAPIVNEYSMLGKPEELQDGKDKLLNVFGRELGFSGAGARFITDNILGTHLATSVAAFTDAGVDWANDTTQEGGSFQSAVGGALLRQWIREPSQVTKFAQPYYELKKKVTDDYILMQDDISSGEKLTAYGLNRMVLTEDALKQFKNFSDVIKKNNDEIKKMTDMGVSRDNPTIKQYQRINSSMQEAVYKVATKILEGQSSSSKK